MSHHPRPPDSCRLQNTDPSYVGQTVYPERRDGCCTEQWAFLALYSADMESICVWNGLDLLSPGNLRSC